jgi:hypothetical protein
MRMILISNVVDENDYHYARRGTMTTLPMWVLGRGANDHVASVAIRLTGRAGEGLMWVGGSTPQTSKPSAPPPRALKAPRSRDRT